MPTPTPDVPVRIPARAWWLPLLGVLLVTGTGLALVLAHLGSLPDPVVRHWGADGRPNGWQSRTMAVATCAWLPLLMPAILLATGFAARVRAMGAIAVGLSAFMSCITAGGLLLQRDGRQPDIGPLLFGGALLGVLLGGMTYLAIRRRGPRPRAERAGRLPAGSPELEVPTTVRLAWTGQVRRPRQPLPIVLLAVGPTSAMGGLFASLGNWWPAALMLVLTLALGIGISSLGAEVSIDADGVVIRSLGFVTWVNVPLSNIESATVLPNVEPFGDFGGWGIREGFDGTRKGFVTGRGEALLLHRAGEKDLVITIDDAERAAATVNTLLRREA